MSSPAAAVPALRAARPSRDRGKKPIGRTIFFALGFVVIGAGGFALYDAFRHKALADSIEKTLKIALQANHYQQTKMTGERVYEQIFRAALSQNMEIPRSRTWIKIFAQGGTKGEIVRVQAKVLLRRKLMKLIDYPVYREVEALMPARYLREGYEAYQTPASEPIVGELQKAGKLYGG